MTDRDAFVGGGGRMGALLRALPGFDPPAGMEARFLAALPAQCLPDADGRFEVPDTLADAVLAEAALLDAAQAPRRAAALAEIHRHGVQQALGSPLGRASRDWLAAQSVTRPARARPAARRPWLAPLGGALVGILAVGVALQVMWQPPSASPVTAAPVPAPAASIRAEKRASPPEAPTARPEEKASSVERFRPPPATLGGTAAPEPSAEMRDQAPSPQRAQTSGAPSAAFARAQPLADARPRGQLPAAAPAPAPAPPPPAALSAGRPASADEHADTTRTAAKLALGRYSLRDEDGIVAALAVAPRHLDHWSFEVTATDRAAAQALAEAVRRQLAARGREVSIHVVAGNGTVGWIALVSDGE